MAKLETSDNLWREVSSLSMLELVSYVENKFGVVVRPIDFAPQNFSSLAAIARFVVTRSRP
jgi:acyl carrier protein